MIFRYPTVQDVNALLEEREMLWISYDALPIGLLTSIGHMPTTGQSQWAN
jgi:hypothetical protein